MHNEEYERGYVQALRDMVAHCSVTMQDRDTPRDGKDEHLAMISFMERLIATKEARLAADSPAERAG